jgi:hypothetical protein
MALRSSRQDLSSVVESATRKLHADLLRDASPGMEHKDPRKCSPALKTTDDDMNVTATKTVENRTNLERCDMLSHFTGAAPMTTNRHNRPSDGKQALSVPHDGPSARDAPEHRGSDTPETVLADAKMVGIPECGFATRAKIVRAFGAGRFGRVNLIRMEIGDECRVFAAKYYENVDGCESTGDTFTRVLNAFSAVHHRCLATVLYYQKAVRGSGPIIATGYFEFGSLNSLLNDVRGGNRVGIWTPTARVLVICGIVCGL